ncbi:MAG: hypothetical protein J6U23_01215 [Clostridiales bacterium]|nr:hypothetical protein [Clostridiales bacterium]
MKSKKAARFASVFLSASIAVTVASCTVEFSDEEKTIGSVMETITEIQKETNAQEQDSSLDDQSNNSNDDPDIDDSGNDVSDNANITDVSVIDNAGQYSGTGNSGASGNGGVVIITSAPANKPDKPNNPAQDNNATGNNESDTNPGKNDTEEPKSSESATPTPSKKVTATPTATPTSKPTSNPTSKPTTPTPEPSPAVITRQNFSEEFDLSVKDGYYTGGWYLNWELGFTEVNPGDKEVLITYGGQVFHLPITYSEDLGVVLANTFLVNRNGTNYIYVCDTVGNDLHDTNIYKIDGNAVVYVGTVTMLSFVDIPSPDSFYGREWGGMGLMYSHREFRVGDDGIPEPVSDVRTFESLTNKLAFNIDLNGYVIKDGVVTNEAATLPHYSFATLLETDGSTYLDVIDGNGTTIRLDFKEIYQNHYDTWKVDLFYNAIGELLYDWKDPWE